MRQKSNNFLCKLYQILAFAKMSSNTDLTSVLKSILEKNAGLAELAQDEYVFGTILNIISGSTQSDNSKSLPNFLADECGIKYTDIMFLINDLINNSTSLTILGEKIMKLWLTIKIYEIVDAFRINPQASTKRKNIQEVFKNYPFQGGNLESLVQASLNSVKEPFQKDDIVGIAEDFSANKSEEIKKLFAKKQVKPSKKSHVNNEISSYNADKSAEEQLKDLISDFKMFPEGSFEKLLQAELIIAHAIKFQLQSKIQEEFPFKSELGQLKRTYARLYGSLTSEIEELFNRIDNQQKKNTYENLFTLKTKIFPINVLELQRLINKTNDARKLIKGKDIIFVIGNTGSGKSTNILKFLGYTLELGDYNGLETLIPVQKLDNAHKTFYTSPEAKSCTRYINAVAVPDKMYPKGTPNNKKTLIICDSPGFGDSAGVEVDIANGVGMINALHGANSVRVVVILPYHSLVGDRMDGAIKMGEIISNLFYELTILKSVQIYFNKVPSKEIEQISLKVENKIKNLTQTQKSNQKLTTFLNEILQSSRNSNNFLDPMQDDYKKLFAQLFDMVPIKKVKESFQYEFADSTKKEIEKFVQGEKSKVKDYFTAKKYDHARFHLKMLEILKNILINNDKIKGFYQELIQFIQKESANNFTKYEQYITEIVNCQSNSSTEKKLKNYKDAIIQIHHLFNQFQEILLVSEEKVDALINEKKSSLLEHFADLSGLNDEKITAVKAFSKILSPNLDQQASRIIDNFFSSTFQELQGLVKEKKYSQIKDKLHNLLILYKYTQKLSQPISFKSASDKMEGLKKALEQEVEEGIKIITQIISQPSNLKAKTVNEANVKIENIKQIESLKFLEKNQEIRQRLSSLLKQIEGMCKKTVRELDNVRLTLNEEVQSNANIEENQLSSKKKAIEFLMKIDCIGDNLKEDYEYAIENISRKLKENVEILRNGIAALKGNKKQEIYRNLQNIKKATAIVLRCSKIIDKGEESKQLALSIQSEFMNFLTGEIQILKDFEIKLNRVPQQSYFQKIIEQCHKIQTYAKLGIIGNKIKQAVQSIRRQFKMKLNTPLKEFLDRQIIVIQEKKSYKFLTYSLDKLEKLCTYLFQAEDNFSMQYRSQIKEQQILIADRLMPFFQAIQKDVTKFLELQDSMNEHPPSLKDLVKTLLTVNTKKKTCQFLNLRADFNIEDHINNVQRKLKQIFDHLENSFTSHARAAQVQALYESCKYYSDIEQYYKESKFGFKDLQKKCSLAFAKSLQNDQDRIKALLKDTSPTKISFPTLKAFYQQFKALKGPQGAKKRRFIVDQLRVVQKSYQGELIQFKKEMDNPDFINKDDFLKAFQEANVLVKQLNELYTEEEDKKSILIQKEDIRKIGIKIISVFQSKFQIVYYQIMEQNVHNVEQSLKSFGYLEAMIYEAFPLEAIMEQHQLGTKVVGREDEKEEMKLINFVLNKIDILKSKIQSHPHLKEERLNAKNTKRLKILLDYLRKGTQKDIDMKYKTVLTIQLNSGFQKYYSSCNKDQKSELIGKINQKMDMLFDQYKQKMIESGDVAQSFQNDIETYFNYLPSEISKDRRKELKKLKQSLTNSLDKDIEDASKIFQADPAKSKDFFSQSRLSLVKKQNGIHQKYVKKFEAIFDQSNFTVLRLQKKFEFINLYIIKVLEDNDTYFKEDSTMLQSLNKRFSKNVQELIKEGKENLKTILEFMENLQTQHKDTYFQQLISNTFKIYTFILTIKDDLYGDLGIRKKSGKSQGDQNIINIKQLKEQYAGDFQTKIVEIGRQFIIGVGNRPSEKINSTDILDHNKMKKVQTYIQYLKLGGFITNHIQLQIKIIQKSKINRSSLKKFEKVDFAKILKEHEIQMEMMYKFCDDFQFYTQQKRNWAPKLIEQDIKCLDNYFRILTERKQFFNKDIISSHHQNFNFDGIKPKILKKFEDLVQSSKTEIKQTFQSYQGQPATKVNLLVTQLQAMDKKQLKIIKSDIVKENHKEIKELVKSESAQICAKAVQQFNDLKEKLDDLNKKVTALEANKKSNIQQENEKCKTQQTTKKKDTQEKFNARIDLQTSEDQKTQFKNAMKAQINSIKKDLNDIKVKNIAEIQKKYSEQLRKYNQSISPVIDNYTNSVKIVKRSLLDLCVQAEKRRQMAKKLLTGVDKFKAKYIRMIQNSFDKDEKGQRSIGKQILNSEKIFRHYQASNFSRLIVGQDINYVADNLERITLNGRKNMTKDELDSIKSCYAQFKQRYDKLKEKYKNDPSDTTISYMVQPIQTLGKQIKKEFYFSVSPDKSAVNKLHLLAGIFALWAILKSQVIQGEVEFTIEPHPTQITTLILLLGISHPDEQLDDRLAQVGTGQGKSIVLAGLSCYLALVGFKVRCACYSAYLSGRDQQSFKFLFSKLNVQNQIKYGTFHELCEDILNSGGSNLKQSVQSMLLQPPKGFFDKLMNAIGVNFVKLNKGANQIQDNPTILVIDEVDVFFDDSYFGKNYCPGIELKDLKDSAVNDMLKHVWKEVCQKQKDIEPDSLIKSQPFEKLVDKYPTLKDLLKNQVHGMVAGALNYKHDYVIVNQRIGYKDGDSISFKINYGYKTVFANLYEYDRGKISRQSLDEALQICLMIAEFSYAKLPVYFKNILGVTGTLEVLPRYKKEQLVTRYKINDQFAIPSAFGNIKRRKEDYTITSKDLFYQSIINKIDQIQHNRPIIIFFKSPRELNQFYVHPLFEPYQSRANSLTEEHDPFTRDSRIVRAVDPKNITLMTNSFGRGTDFVLLDDKIKQEGGLHVIQAFLSLDESQQVQIKGRTARQSGKGSYDCTLNQNWLEQLDLKPQDIPKNATSDMIHTILLKARESKIAKQAVSTLNSLKVSDDMHEKTVNIFTKPKLAQSDLIDYVSGLNKYPEIRKVVIKTVLGLDATGSMSAGLKRTCQIIGNAFTEAYAVLNKDKVQATIEIKIMVYRNYNSPKEQILQSTTFENTPVNLKAFLERVGPKGGWGNEALQVLFQSLNKEKTLDQVILIGDAAPNSVSDVQHKRKDRGTNFWMANGFPATHIDKQIADFASKNCPVHSFYLNNGAGFKQISAKTQGQAAPFNINSPTVTKDLSSFVVTNILKLIQKNSGSVGLVQSYRKMFS